MFTPVWTWHNTSEQQSHNALSRRRRHRRYRLTPLEMEAAFRQWPKATEFHKTLMYQQRRLNKRDKVKFKCK